MVKQRHMLHALTFEVHLGIVYSLGKKMEQLPIRQRKGPNRNRKRVIAPTEEWEWNRRGKLIWKTTS